MSIEISLVPLAFAVISEVVTRVVAANERSLQDREAAPAKAEVDTSISNPAQPAGLSAAPAVRPSEPLPMVQQVQTRMRDVGLLAAALTDTHASVTRSGDVLDADWRGVHARFRRGNDGIWVASLTGQVGPDAARNIVLAVDQAYGRQVQRATIARLRSQAPLAGMNVRSETVEADDSVTLVLDVVRGA